jgi:hypothetical protein
MTKNTVATGTTRKTDKNSRGNADIPSAVYNQFKTETVRAPRAPMTMEGWESAMRTAQVKDHRLKIVSRICLTVVVTALLFMQNIGIWFIIVWALNKNCLDGLQLIFSTLIAGSLAQSYLLLRLITERVFREIDYSNGGADKQFAKKKRWGLF